MASSGCSSSSFFSTGWISALELIMSFFNNWHIEQPHRTLEEQECSVYIDCLLLTRTVVVKDTWSCCDIPATGFQLERRKSQRRKKRIRDKSVFVFVLVRVKMCSKMAKSFVFFSSWHLVIPCSRVRKTTDTVRVNSTFNTARWLYKRVRVTVRVRGREKVFQLDDLVGQNSCWRVD